MYKYLILFFVVISCGKKQTLPDCDFVNALKEKDQSFKNKHLKELSPFHYYIDSLAESGFEELNMFDFDIMADSLAALVKVEKEVIDSLWVLQEQIDKEVTEDLIEVLKNYDKNTFDLSCYKCGRESLTLFVHSPVGYKDEIKEVLDMINLIDIDSTQYRHILWHLNGRDKQEY